MKRPLPIATKPPGDAEDWDAHLQYPEPDGEPIAESDQAREALLYGVQALQQHFQERADVYVSGNLWISYQRGVEDAACAPDVFVIFGVPNRPRTSYRVWQEGGKLPDFILEVTSNKTRYHDSVRKPDLYAEMGVTEYFQYDPTGDYLRPALQGLRLVAGEYQPIDPRLGEQLGLRLESAVLGLELHLSADGALRFWNPQTAAYYLPSAEQLQVLQNQMLALERERQAEQQRIADLERERDELRQQLAALQAERSRNEDA